MTVLCRRPGTEWCPGFRAMTAIRRPGFRAMTVLQGRTGVRAMAEHPSRGPSSAHLFLPSCRAMTLVPRGGLLVLDSP